MPLQPADDFVVRLAHAERFGGSELRRFAGDFKVVQPRFAFVGIKARNQHSFSNFYSENQ
jgi:thiosulfate reductase cytochrome b subunit